MKSLPKGYYAVLPDGSDVGEKIFEYRGERFECEPGVNLFSSLPEAAAAAVEIPDEVIAGLPYESFAAPVVLLSAGDHLVDKTEFTRPAVLLGNNAGVNPNLPAEGYAAPFLNPAREENETKLTGSYWRGICNLSGDGATLFIADGFSAYMARFQDYRNRGPECRIELRNIINLSHCGKNLYAFGVPAADGGIRREVYLKNMRLSDFDDLDYGGIYLRLSAEKVEIDGLCYEKTGQLFGFCDLAREIPGCPKNAKNARYTVKNSYFGDLSGDRELSFGTPGEDGTVTLEVSRCVFNDASIGGRPPLSAVLGPGSSLTVSDCAFIDRRGNPGPAVSVAGEGGEITVSGCSFEGFGVDSRRETPPPTDAPSKVSYSPGPTGTDDPHVAIEPSREGLEAIERLYAGTTVAWGDLHVHTACGGTSDGKTPMADFPAAMDDLGLDFAAVVDHRQMRGFFLPEWDEKRFIIGTEPGTRFLGLSAVRHGQDAVHYNMLFPHKYSLALVLANFPEFEFRGDELGGSFKYPKFTKERFAELTAYVKSIGGIMVHPHPKTMLASDDPLEYSFGDGTFLETIYGSPATHASFKNYSLWKALLDRGEHVWASSGTDTHSAVSNKAPAAFYTSEKSGDAYFKKMRTADFAVGIFGLQMTVGGAPMGSELGCREGDEVILRVADAFAPAMRPGTAYEIRILSDRGIAFAATFDGTPGQTVAVRAENRRFYRAEIFDLTHGYPVALGNPVWCDGKYENETQNADEV